MTTLTVNRTIPVSSPRGARWAAQVFSALLDWIENAARRNHERRQQTSRLTDAARVRSYAQDIASQDPRFASDLFAAADRHERG